MNKEELNKVSDLIYNYIDPDKAYLGFEEWTPHEFCIKANIDGLKSFAVDLLEVCKSDIEGTKMNLQSRENNYINNDLDIQFIELTNKSKVEIRSPQKEESPSKNKLTNIALGFFLILVLYLLVAGVIFTVQIIF